MCLFSNQQLAKKELGARDSMGRFIYYFFVVAKCTFFISSPKKIEIFKSVNEATKNFFWAVIEEDFFKNIYSCERIKEKMESFFITEYDKCMSKKCFTVSPKERLRSECKWSYNKTLFEGTSLCNFPNSNSKIYLFRRIN